MYRDPLAGPIKVILPIPGIIRWMPLPTLDDEYWYTKLYY